MTDWTPLSRDFYDRDVIDVARDLLGRRLVRATRGGKVSGWIVEVEAYRGHDDPASHAYRGRTRRNASMFGGPGRAYVYTIHAKFCLNVIAQTSITPCGILIRAIEPATGIPQMRTARGSVVPTLLARDDAFHDNLTSGPARLCQAMHVDRRLDGWNLFRGRRLWVAEEKVLSPFQIASAPRIGITAATEKLWRFFVDGNRNVSGPRHHHTIPKSSFGSRSAE
jgi:DNA-3-methyladenine glycosylase